MTKTTLTNDEVICTWMEPNPEPPSGVFYLAGSGSPILSRGGWWLTVCPSDNGYRARWVTRPLTLDLLREVQGKLTPELWLRYEREFVNQVWLKPESLDHWVGAALNATVEQKINALVPVLRSLVEANAVAEGA